MPTLATLDISAKARRGPGESYSDVILRLAAGDGLALENLASQDDTPQLMEGGEELLRAIAEYVAFKRMLSTKEIRQHIRLLLVARGLFPLRKGSVFKIHDVTSLCRLAEQVVALANLFLCHLLCLLQRGLVAS
jgi:hypothetical protein